MEIKQLQHSEGVAVGAASSFEGTATAKSADYTVTDTDNIRTVLMTTGASDRTVTLPTAADNAGRTLTVKKVDSGAGKCIIDGEGAETVDGGLTLNLIGQYDEVAVQCDGSNWHVVSRSGIPVATLGTNGTTLTNLDRRHQIYNSSSGACVLPTTSIKAGEVFVIENRSATDLDINASGGTKVVTIRTGRAVVIALQDAPTTNAHWLLSDVQDTGTFTGTLTGCTTSPTGTVYWSRSGKSVTILLPEIVGTSNTTAATITGMPSSLYPARVQYVAGYNFNSGTAAWEKWTIDTSGVITLFKSLSSTGFTNSGTKGIKEANLSFSMA